MALERKLLTFDGGDRPVPDQKPLNCPDETINYEQLQKGILEKRRDPIVFEASFDTVVKAAFNAPSNGSIIDYAPEPFYPANLPSDITDGYDYLIPVYGNIGGSPSAYKLYLFYKATRNSSNAWVYKTADTPAVNLLQGIYDDGVNFTGNSKLRFSYDKNLLYVVDNVNNLFFITTDKDGNVVSAKCGIPAPKSRPQITAMDGWEDQYFEEDNIADGIGNVGLIRVIYNSATKEGYKSNPSPASEFADFQWIKLDAGSQDRWLKKFQVTNVKIPDSINDYIKSELKYFDFYFEIFLYSEGLDAKHFEFSCRKEIFDKDGANSYTIAMPSTATILADWENDVAPVAKDLVAFDGKVVLAQVKEQLRFPFQFDNIYKIKLNNQDNRTYIDAVVKIRLYDKDSSDSKKIEDLDWNDFSSILLKITINRHRLRIYDSDLTTPLSVVVVNNSSPQNYFDIYVKIPQIQASSVHTVYFCFGGEGASSGYRTALYGHWIRNVTDSFNNWSDQRVFQPERVKNEDSLLCSPMEISGGEVYNKADTEHNSITSPTWDGNALAKMIILNKLIGSNHINTDVTFGGNNAGDGFKDLTDLPDRGYFYGRIKTGTLTPDPGFDRFCGLFEFVSPFDQARVAVIHYNGFWGFNSINNLFDTGSVESNTEYFLCASWDIENEKASLFISKLDDFTTFQSDEISYTYSNVGFTKFMLSNIESDQFQIVSDNYLNGDNADDLNTVKNIANFMPAFSNMIGYKYSPESFNNNITFEKVDNSLKAKSILRWSKKGGFAFPDTYYKSGIPTPIVRIVQSLSTLALQSQNVIKIYLRNGLYKFIAEGDPSIWADLSNNLIQQNKRFGLLQQDCIAETPYGEFHLSEAGIIQWIGDRLNIVTNLKTEEGEYKIIDIPLDKVYIMFYCPLRQQLWIQERYEEKFLVTEAGKFITTQDGRRIKLQL